MSLTEDRARMANWSRNRKPDDPDFVNLRRDFYAERLAEHVAKVVAKAPPLTAEQRDRIAALLTGGAA